MSEVSLTESIWEGEVVAAIQQLNRRTDVGTGNIAASILLRTKYWVSPIIADILKSGKYNNKLDTGRIQRIVTFLHKNKGPLNRDDKRPITLRDLIYKICAFIVGNRLTPMANLLTDEKKTAYESNRSTLDAISLIELCRVPKKQINSPSLPS